MVFSQGEGGGDRVCGGSEIGYAAFKECEKIAGVVIPASVKEIEKFAFAGCKGIETVEIRGNVETIGEGVFDGCEKLRVVRSRIEVPTEANKIAVGKGVKIYVPMGSVERYRAAWGEENEYEEEGQV